MNLHEYQSKQLFKLYHLPVPKGQVAYSVEDALQVASMMDSPRLVVKAQVHAGGRGKAGGVKLVSNKEPNTPPLVIVNVPPCISSIESLP